MRPAKNSALLLLLAASVAAALTSCARTEDPAAESPEAGAPAILVPDTKPVPEVKWLEATVPEGTVLKTSLIGTLSSETSRKGEMFRVLVTEAIMIEGTVTVPSGSNVLGTVRDVVPASTGFQGKGGMLGLEFSRIDTPTGASAPLKGTLSGVAPGRTSVVLAGEAAPGVVVARAKGREAVLESSTAMTLVLDEPLLIKVKQ